MIPGEERPRNARDPRHGALSHWQTGGESRLPVGKTLRSGFDAPPALLLLAEGPELALGQISCIQ
jgi:hypothetical protein